MVPELLIEKANIWINAQYPEQELIVLTDTIVEYQYCYSFSWCKKSEENLDVKDRSIWVGAGRLLASKDGAKFGFEGSSPGVDWIHYFELEVQGMEDI